MIPVRWICASILWLGLLSYGEARPRVFSWEVNNKKTSLKDKIHAKFEEPKARFQDLDYFNPNDFDSSKGYDDDSYGNDVNNFDNDFSGYDSDDEDLSVNNKIHTVARPDAPSVWKRDPHAYLPEEYFGGNELHEIDKLSELRKRMTEMQKEMREMQNLLRNVKGR